MQTSSLFSPPLVCSRAGRFTGTKGYDSNWRIVLDLNLARVTLEIAGCCSWKIGKSW